MTRQIVLRPRGQEVMERRQPLLAPQDGSSGRGTRFAEVAGGTTAECAVVCCCCPCALVNLLVLGLYTLPKGLCRKALLRRRRRRLLNRGRLQPKAEPQGCGCDCECYWDQIHPMGVELVSMKSLESDKDVMELEQEMWDRFYGAGFWRSSSQRSDLGR